MTWDLRGCPGLTTTNKMVQKMLKVELIGLLHARHGLWHSLMLPYNIFQAFDLTISLSYSIGSNLRLTETLNSVTDMRLSGRENLL
jgi:hypothetical protein